MRSANVTVSMPINFAIKLIIDLVFRLMYRSVFEFTESFDKVFFNFELVHMVFFNVLTHIIPEVLNKIYLIHNDFCCEILNFSTE